MKTDAHRPMDTTKTLEQLKKEGAEEFLKDFNALMDVRGLSYEETEQGVKDLIGCFAEKAFRAGQLATLDAVEDRLKENLSEVIAPPEDAKRFMGDWERGVVTGGFSVKERALAAITDLREKCV